jgi:hypothetical protein
MTAIAIFPDATETPSCYRAISGQMQGMGRTAGEALDALVAQLDVSGIGPLLVVQPCQADAWFTAEQQQRLQELMDRWRTARDSGIRLPAQEQAELDALVEAELRGAIARSEALARRVGA